jgi:hypothetical protein
MDGVSLLWNNLPQSWRPDPEERANFFVSSLEGAIVQETCVFWKTRYKTKSKKKKMVEGGDEAGIDDRLEEGGGEEERNRFCIHTGCRINVKKISFAWIIGRVPVGRIINICGNKKCINPYHMVDGSTATPKAPSPLTCHIESTATTTNNNYSEGDDGDECDKIQKKKRRHRLTKKEVLDILQKNPVDISSIKKRTISKIQKEKAYKKVIESWKSSSINNNKPQG